MQKQERPITQNLTCVSRLDDFTHSLRGYKGVYYLHNEALWGGESKSCLLKCCSKNGLREQGKKNSLGVLLWLHIEARVRVLIYRERSAQILKLPLVPMADAQRHSYQLSTMWRRVREMRLKCC